MRSSRLLSMLLLLQTHERMTSRELAERFEVSPRTVLRDVEALSAAGVPVYTERGRGGAIVLDRRARLDPARLDPAEIELLSVAGLDPRLLESVGLHAVGARAQEKLGSVAARRRDSGARSLSEVLLIDPSGWYVEGPDLDLADLVEAARQQRRVRLNYRRSGEAEGQWLVADPYGLASKGASWYLVADVDGQPRLFTAGRIDAQECLDDAAVLREGQDLHTVWSELMETFHPAPVVKIRALLRSTRLDLARRILGTRMTTEEQTDGDWVPIALHYPDVESVRQLLQFGDHIRVLAPPEAVERVHELAADLMRRHQPAHTHGS